MDGASHRVSRLHTQEDLPAFYKTLAYGHDLEWSRDAVINELEACSGFQRFRTDIQRGAAHIRNLIAVIDGAVLVKDEGCALSALGFETSFET